MNILFVASNCSIFEINSGGAMRNNMFVRALSKIGHVDVISFYQKHLVSNINNCDVIYSEIIKEEHSNWESLRSWLLITLKPKDPTSYYKKNKKKVAIVDYFVKKTDCDIIACRYINSVVICGLLKYKERLVIDMDDHPANSLRYMIPQTKLIVVRWKKQCEMQRIGRMVEELLDSVACSFYSNVLEKPSAHSVYLHNTINIKEFVPDVNESMEPRILYVGVFYHTPSRNGIFHFVEKIFPLIRKRVPEAKLRIVGKGEKEWLDSLNKQEGVEAVGYVEDIVSEYRNARIVVVPIYQGTGTCIKFVEGLMMNRPVVSTPVGARGFDTICQNKEHYMLAKNDEEFADKTIELLFSLSTSQKMARKGYEIAQMFFSQERFCEIVKKSLIK